MSRAFLQSRVAEPALESRAVVVREFDEHLVEWPNALLGVQTKRSVLIEMIGGYAPDPIHPVPEQPVVASGGTKTEPPSHF
jgi:hypothetical protein